MALGITAIAQSPISSLGSTSVNIAVSGIDISSNLGTPTILANANVNVTGVQLSSNISNVSVELNTPVNLSGQDLTFNIGNESVVTDVDVTTTGQQLSTTIGSFAIQIDNNVDIIAGAEQELETDLGALTLTGTANVPVTGVSTSALLGNAESSVSKDVPVTGLTPLGTNTGSVEIKLNTPVNITGFGMTISEATPLVTAWSNVDPDVNNTWTEVDTEVSNTWTEVDIAA